MMRIDWKCRYRVTPADEWREMEFGTTQGRFFDRVPETREQAERQLAEMAAGWIAGTEFELIERVQAPTGTVFVSQGGGGLSGTVQPGPRLPNDEELDQALAVAFPYKRHEDDPQKGRGEAQRIVEAVIRRAADVHARSVMRRHGATAYPRGNRIEIHCETEADADAVFGMLAQD